MKDRERYDAEAAGNPGYPFSSSPIEMAEMIGEAVRFAVNRIASKPFKEWTYEDKAFLKGFKSVMTYRREALETMIVDLKMELHDLERAEEATSPNVRMTPEEQPQGKEEQPGTLEVESGMTGNTESVERKEDQREKNADESEHNVPSG